MRLPIWVVDVACAGCVRDGLAGPHRPGPMAGWPTRSARSAAVMQQETCSTGAGSSRPPKRSRRLAVIRSAVGPAGSS
jgi:hypothetical protein